VLISRNELDFRTVLLDNRAGAEALGGELTRIGYRRFAVVTGGEGLRTAADRLEGFRAGLAAGGGRLDEADVMREAFTRDGGYEGTRALIERGLDGIELVFAANDVMAVGALSAIRDAGLTPGRDLAVAGFDDIPTVQDVTPPLTTVRVPLEELGCRALRLAIDGADVDGGVVTTEVVLRASTPSRA
jgi:LacI family transcriptional regulator